MDTAPLYRQGMSVRLIVKSAVALTLSMTGYLTLVAGNLSGEPFFVDHTANSLQITLMVQDRQYAYSCLFEHEANKDEPTDNAWALADIVKLGDIGYPICAAQGTGSIPIKLGGTTPHPSDVLAFDKGLLSHRSAQRCSDIINPLISMCPRTLGAHIEQMKNDTYRS